MKRLLFVIIIFFLLLCGCSQNECVYVFPDDESPKSPLAIRDDGVCFELSDDLNSFLESLQGKKTDRQLSDVCAHFRFVISRTVQIGETSYTRTTTDDHWSDIYISDDNCLQLEGAVYEIDPEMTGRLRGIYEDALGDEKEPAFPNTIDYLAVNPCLSTMFTVREHRPDFQQIIGEMTFRKDGAVHYQEEDGFAFYCGGFISVNEDTFIFNGEPYRTDEKKAAQLKNFYAGINTLIVNAEKPYNQSVVKSATTTDKSGNTVVMTQEQCDVLTLLLQDVTVYEAIREPSMWEWGMVYVGAVVMEDGSSFELYAGQEVIMMDDVMLHVSVDSAYNIVQFIRAVRDLCIC